MDHAIPEKQSLKEKNISDIAERTEIEDIINLSWDDDPDYDSEVDEEIASKPEGFPDQKLDPEKLLDRLFDRGVLPRYAFPTDVVTFHVFDNTRSTERRAELKYTPQLGLNQALSSYAPGREIWVNGERYYSFAVWTPFGRRDCWNAWRARKIYFECGRCGYARVENSGPDYYVGQALNCPACGTSGSLGVGMQWVRPAGFAHPVDIEAELPLAESPTPTRATRAKLSASFKESDTAKVSETLNNGAGYVVWAAKQRLLITNTGARDRQFPGFRHCPSCGRTEPNGWIGGKLKQRKGHRRPNPDHHPHGEICNENQGVVVFGNEFETDIALIRFRLAGAARLPPGTMLARIVLTTVAEALGTAAAHLLDIEDSDIGAEYRVAMTPAGQSGKEVEVYLYDLAPGGAGFVRAASRDVSRLLDAALQRLNSCDCTHSCYQCLRSYKNRWDHKYLHRTLGAAFLGHVANGEVPTVAEDDEHRLLRILAVDFTESGHPVTELEGGLHLVGQSRYIVLGHPLMPDRPGSLAGRKLAEANDVTVVDSLMVDQALPAAVRMAIREPSVTSSNVSLPSFLVEQADGHHAYHSSMFRYGETSPPLAKVRLDSVPSDAFVVQLTRPTLERIPGADFRQGAWVVFTPVADDIFTASHKDPHLIVRRNGAFNATGECWTLGRPMMRGEKLKIMYNSYKAPRSETLPPLEVKAVGRVYAVFVDGVLKRTKST